jgi:predicted nucleic acid-binding protein
LRTPWLDANLGEYEILAVTAETASAYADLRHELKELGRPIPENDLWICALARGHRMPVMSRDRHFAFVPKLRVESW